MLRGKTAIVSRLGLDAKSACRLEAAERKGHVGPVEVSGADSAGVKRRSHHAEALCRGSHQATLCCLQPGLLGPGARLPPRELGRKRRRKVVGEELEQGCWLFRRQDLTLKNV